ncbi:hypothetical protein CPLU01_10851 [Colletotrichum plurivorum]|uniref:Uncharacterized protein n=1 Tax=Colletotrichum plurivorum TaxID=2175906 RepID=A0A8H6N9H5_9PEZI|nr:hypothetical protein CPLU01_10851 [Colletotrichum plurivorum]
MMDNLQHLSKRTSPGGDSRARLSGPPSEPLIQYGSDQSLTSGPQKASNFFTPPFWTENVDSRAFGNRVQTGGDERRPFLPPPDIGDRARSREREDIPALASTIRRKPVSASFDSKVSQPASSINEVLAEETDTVKSGKPLWRIWAFELFCILLNILLFIFVLYKFSNQDLPDWPFGATLNSFLALATTMSKASFMIPVSVAISQTQWAWISKKPRPLYDIHVIDQASRGTWGSLVLLWRFRFQHVAVLGSLLFAFSAFTSPITQLAISYPMRDIAVIGEATAQVVREVRSPEDRLKMAGRQAVYQALFADHAGFMEPFPYSTVASGAVFCSTGNCTFDRYDSLGICMKTANISSHLRVEEFRRPGNFSSNDTLVLSTDGLLPDRKVWKVSLPGAHSMAHQSRLTAFTDMLTGNLTFGFRDDPILRARIASFAIMYTTPLIHDRTWWDSPKQREPSIQESMNNFEEFRHDATEIIFHLCVHTHETTVHKGVESTKVVESLTEPAQQGTGPFLDIDCWPMVRSFRCAENEARWNETFALKSPTPGDSYSANYRSMEDLSGALRYFLAGYMTTQALPEDSKAFGFYGAGSEFTKALCEAVIFGYRSLEKLDVLQRRLETLYQDIATGLSASIRTGRADDTFVHGAYNVTGEPRGMVPYVKITWAWFSLLAFEIAVATLFLAITMVRQTGDRDSVSRDVKDSSLATLVALSEECRAAAGGRLGPVDELKSASKGLKVQLKGRQIVLAEEYADEKPC